MNSGKIAHHPERRPEIEASFFTKIPLHPERVSYGKNPVIVCQRINLYLFFLRHVFV
jgi:hypothetical protein